MAHMIPNGLGKKFADGDIDFPNDTIKAMLLSNSHTNNPDTQEFIDDVSANEVSGTGYTAGGATLSSASTTQDNTNNRSVLDAGDLTFSSVTLSNVRYVAIYKDTGSAGTSPIIAIFDLGSDQSRTAQDLIINWSSSGLITINQGA